MKNILLIIFTIGVLASVEAQQYPLFSHYTLNEFAFNPALAGNGQGTNAKLTYRNQWVGLPDAPVTMLGNIDGRINNSPIGVGGLVFRDQAGKLERTGISGSAAFIKAVGENSQISVHFQTGGLYLGFAVPQIFETKIKFASDSDQALNSLVRHYYLMGGYRFNLSESIALEPSALVKLQQPSPLQYDLTLRAIFKNMFWIGGSYRSDDAIAALAGITLNDRLTLGYAYDITTSDLNHVSNGSHEITLGLAFGKAIDTDKDGIADKDDTCPEEPGTKENNGCPEDPFDIVAEREKEEAPDNDDDNDGVLNQFDKCPNLPGIRDNGGCPFGDRDSDGVRDDVDGCPDISGLASNGGCPVNDRDKDGVVDHMDKCPDTPGALIAGGCPSTDSDGDGIVDSKDNCPNVKGTFGNAGCPDGSKLSARELDFFNVRIRNVYYDFDKDFIRQNHFAELDELAEILIRFPDWKVSLQGHADERGTLEYNIDLSKRRVNSVRNYLINRGVQRSQLIINYYGEATPDQPGRNEGEHQLNRRVELQYVFDY